MWEVGNWVWYFCFVLFWFGKGREEVDSYCAIFVTYSAVLWGVDDEGREKERKQEGRLSDMEKRKKIPGNQN